MEVMEELQTYRYERRRLETFQAWPANAKVEAWKMAKAGLRYTGQEEEVTCAWCGCVLGDWQYGDQVMARHRLASPDCAFVTDQSDNVPVLSGEEEGGEETADEAPPPLDNGLSSPPSHPRHLTSGLSTDQSQDRLSPEGPTELDFRSEADRLASFAQWTVSFIRPTDLAKAGFYSLNNLDSCKCAFCHNCVGDWVEGDQPMEEHRALFPLCPFMQGRDVGNVPISQSSSAPVLRPQSGSDETGIRWQSSHRNPNSGPEQMPLPVVSSAPLAGGKSPESIGIMKHSGPLHPQHATLEARLRTFREWPPALRQQPAELADAGFYYIGCSDQVKCFYCDGGLRNWQPEDAPWVEHARWFSKCVFVRLVKGDEFIAKCLAERPPEKVVTGGNGGRQVTEEEVRRAMSQAIVRQVLSMGIDASRVKMAIKNQLESSGNAFESAEHLINAAFSVQREQERRSRLENLNPSGATLTGLGEGEGRSRSERVELANLLGEEIRMEVEEEVGSTVSLTPRSPATSTATSSLTPATPTAAPPAPGSSSAISSSTSSSQQEQELASISAELRELAASSKEKNANTTSPTTSAPGSPKDDLESENARLKEQRTCKICMDGEVGVVFLPCGHLCSCVLCAPSLRDCPVCRTNIQGTVRTFLS